MSFFKKMKVNSMVKKHAKLMTQAMQAQRNGNMELFAKLSAEAEKLYQEIEQKRNELG